MRLESKKSVSVKAGSRQPGWAQRTRILMPTNAQTVSRRPGIVIVGHVKCQAEPVSSSCRFPRHQSAASETVTLMTGESTGGRYWLGLALDMPNDDDPEAPRNGLGICGHQIARDRPSTSVSWNTPEHPFWRGKKIAFPEGL